MTSPRLRTAGERARRRYFFPLAAAVLCLSWGAQAQTQLSSCSQTVGATAAAVPFPASGATGPTMPRNYLELCNAHAANTLGVNYSGGTAAIGSAGTVTIQPGGCMWWSTPPTIPAALSVIGSGAGTVTACGYQ